MADADNPGVLVHPPLLFVGGLVLGGLIDWIWPGSFAPIFGTAQVSFVVGIAVLIGAIALLASAMREFSRAGTNVPTNMPAEALVTVGIYQVSRNPIYVGLALLYAGLSLLFDNPWSLALLLPIVLTLHFGVILREEKYLEAKFGEAYRDYCETTRRWI